MSHRIEFELNIVWRHKWAAGLNFVRSAECYCRIVIPRGALLVAYIESGKSYRVFFLLPPIGRKCDGIGVPRTAMGRPVAPWSIQPRRGTAPPQAPKRIASHVRHELQKQFGIKSNWS